jgi:hypothetical protein
MSEPKLQPHGETIADYAWLSKTQRSRHVWLGNPFCIALFRIPLKSQTQAQVIADVRKYQAREKVRFTKKFPDVKWVSM